MFSNHLFGLLYDARKEWREISKEPTETISQVYLRHALLLALIPPFALFAGTTQMGWSIAGGDIMFLETASAAVIAVAFYFSLLLGLALMSFLIHAMEHIFGASVSYERCLMLTVYTSAPLFMAGLAGFVPVFWFDALVVMLAASYSLYCCLLGFLCLWIFPKIEALCFQ